jgi:hypothetical protein
VAIPESVRRTLAERLSARRLERWPELAEVRVRFRAQFAYVEGVLPDEEAIPLCRLTYRGSPDAWGFAPYLASKDGYENSVLPTGSFTGLPEHALDTACGLYLGDVSAWADLFALKRSPPTH